MSDNRYVNSDGDTWSASTLIQYCKEQKYKVFDLPLVGIDLSYLPFSVKTLDEFIYQSNRVKNTNLEYPIILDSTGKVCDGYHRICKAILEGRPTIKAIRIEQMPCRDGKDEE